jgi:hypothetical protein
MSQAPPGTGITDMAQWREAWQIRRAHPRWAVAWIAPAGQYQAYRLSRKQRHTILAATPEDLTAQIEQATQDTHATPPPGRLRQGRTNGRHD